ncbi:apolipoprotein C-IV [Melanotaenia boesemani]|uniref:apolipoprotein C-IV n=1 Tax=Melanotaenia boesemani TaxID=1250792 RepID=UPI001C03DFCE|nr:apolipoprotein C-IV [Melanotaenia boesemani]
MHMKLLVFFLIFLMQALAQTPSPEESDSPGILQRIQERARKARTKIQDIVSLAVGFGGAYYEDHIQPVTDSYVEWATNLGSSLWEKVQATVGN